MTLRAKVRNRWNSAILGIFGVSENLENCPNLPQKCSNSDQNVILTFSVSNCLKSLKFRHSWHVGGEKCWLSSCSQLMYKILCYQAIRNCIKSYTIVRSDFGGSVCWCECVAFIVFMCSVRSLWVCIVGVVWCLTALNSCHHCEQWWRCLHACTVWWWYYAGVSGSPILSNMIPLMSSIVIRESGRNSIWPDSCIWI